MAVALEPEAPPRSSANGDICARLTSSTATVSLSPARQASVEPKRADRSLKLLLRKRR